MKLIDYWFGLGGSDHVFAYLIMAGIWIIGLILAAVVKKRAFFWPLYALFAVGILLTCGMIIRTLSAGIYDGLVGMDKNLQSLLSLFALFVFISMFGCTFYIHRKIPKGSRFK